MTGDGVLQRPGALRRRAAAGDPDGGGDARPGAGPGRAAGQRAGTTSRSDGIAQGYATLGRIGFEGRFDYAAIGSVTNLAARLCAEAEAVAGAGHPAGARRGRGRRRSRSRSVTCEPQGLQPPGAGLRHQGPRRQAGEPMTGTQTDAATRGPHGALSDLGRGRALPAFDELQQRMPDVWESMRLDLADESVVVVPSVSLEHATRQRSGSLDPGLRRNGSCSCCCCCGSRGCGWST